MLIEEHKHVFNVVLLEENMVERLAEIETQKAGLCVCVTATA